MNKTAQARVLYLNGEVRAALRIVSNFRIGLTKQDRVILKTGYECLVWPGFYSKVGVNEDQATESAKKLFKRLFIPS